jgi:hypothetical protein
MLAFRVFTLPLERFALPNPYRPSHIRPSDPLSCTLLARRCAAKCIFLHFFAFCKKVSPIFSASSALFAQKHRGCGVPSAARRSPRSFPLAPRAIPSPFTFLRTLSPSAKLIPHVFNIFQTLSAKHPGGYSRNAELPTRLAHLPAPHTTPCSLFAKMLCSRLRHRRPDKL